MKPIALAVAAILVACGDSGSDAEPDPTCVDAQCQRAAQASCNADLTGRVAASVQGTCGGTDGATCVYPDPVAESCAEATGVCIEGACLDLPSLCDWEFGPRISIVSSLRVGHQSDKIDPATQDNEDACCTDFTGDGVPDDALGRIFRTLRDVLVNINPYFKEQILDGHFNLLFDVRGLDDLVDDDAFELLIYESFPEDTIEQTEPTTSGHGTFRVKPRSWLEGTHIPRFHLAGRVEAGRMIMDSGTFSFFFALPDRDGVVELPFEDFVFEGSLALGPDGSGLAIHGTLGGLVDPEALFRTLNNEVDFSCACATFAEGEDAIDVASRQCNTPLTNTCEDTFCLALTTDTCDFVVSIFSPDIDTDGDDKPDRISAGIFMDTTSARTSRIEMFCDDR